MTVIAVSLSFVSLLQKKQATQLFWEIVNPQVCNGIFYWDVFCSWWCILRHIRFPMSCWCHIWGLIPRIQENAFNFFLLQPHICIEMVFGLFQIKWCLLRSLCKSISVVLLQGFSSHVHNCCVVSSSQRQLQSWQWPRWRDRVGWNP